MIANKLQESIQVLFELFQWKIYKQFKKKNQPLDKFGSLFNQISF